MNELHMIRNCCSFLILFLHNCSFSKVCFMIFYTGLRSVHLFCLAIRVVFDTRCLVDEKASVVNCSVKVIIASPQYLVILAQVTAVLNTVVVCATLHLKPPGIEFCGFRTALKRLVKRGSFWILTLSFVFVIVDYVLTTFKKLSAINKAVAITYVLFQMSRIIVVYFINYLPRVKFPRGKEINCESFYTW